MTPLDPEQPIHDQLEALRKESDAIVPPDVRDYYDGAQPPVATIEQMRALGDRAIRPYVENQLKRCTDVIASRLLFRQYLCKHAAVKDALDTFATKAQMSEQCVTNTVRVLVDGNNALALSWGDDRPIVHQEPWWDGDEGMYVEVSDTGVSLWAVKEWTDRTKRKRRTVYLPDRILRYANVGGWQEFGDDELGILPVTPWTRNGQLGGEPLGVPVVHFGNTVTTDSFYGTSTLEPLLGLQDALNGTLFDIVAAQALNAFPIYTATGVDTENTEVSVGPGRLWKGGEMAKFGVLNGGSMDAILDGYKAIRAAIANQFPVAEHLIAGGTFPSGLAIIKAENPMIGHVKLLGDTFAASWVLLAHRATEMMNVFGNAGLNEDAMIQVEYDPPEQLDEGTVTEIDAAKVALYAELATLPKTLMLKTGLVDEAQATAIIVEQAASVVTVAEF